MYAVYAFYIFTNAVAMEKDYAMTKDTDNDWALKAVEFEQAVDSAPDQVSAKPSVRHAVFKLAPAICRLRAKRKDWACITKGVGVFIGLDDVNPVTVKNYHSDWKRLHPQEWAQVRASLKLSSRDAKHTAGSLFAAPTATPPEQKLQASPASPTTPASSPPTGPSADAKTDPSPAARTNATGMRGVGGAPRMAFPIKPDPK